EGPRGASRPVSGGYGEGETPLPIPNRAVKPLSADGTWPARAWESRSPPVLTSDVQAAGSLTGPGRLCFPRPLTSLPMAQMRQFFKDNPQALVLLVITLVLGIGTFIAVLIALGGAGSSTTSGEPSDSIRIAHAALT